MLNGSGLLFLLSSFERETSETRGPSFSLEMSGLGGVIVRLEREINLDYQRKFVTITR